MRPPSRASGPIEDLSPGEQDVLALVAQGRSNDAIAERLHVSRRTVENRIHGIYMKLGLHANRRDHRRVIAALEYLGLSDRGAPAVARTHPRRGLPTSPSAATTPDPATGRT